jgi:putative ABC transport system substrate-binding protein
VTGVTGIGAALSGKQVEALRQVIPRVRRLALLISNVAASFAKELTAQTQAAAKTSGITVHVVSVTDAEELERAFAMITAQHDEGVIVQGPVFTTSFGRIAQLGLRHRLPMIAAPKEFAETGGLLAYGASQIELTRRAMSHVAHSFIVRPPGVRPPADDTHLEVEAASASRPRPRT